ncbi:hypothetical protein FRB95_001619 [Tulasnella sp. JGI-2019a]|nr:hypothetical protein FRB95_001619 [Tulasnella sp. JGI-2019a]
MSKPTEESFASPWADDVSLPPAAPKTRAKVTLDEVGRLNREAQVRGTFIGLVAGIGSAFLTRRFTRYNNPNQMLLTGFLTGIASAYLSAQWILVRNFRKLQH